MAHGEGLAGQDAVGHDGLEQLLLAHSRELEADVAGLAAQLVRHFVAMDVVHFAAVLLEIGVQEGLERAHRQLHPGIGHRDGTGMPCIGVGDGVALALPFVGAGIGGLHRLQHLFGLHAEEDTVDRLELEGVVVIIHHFHQSIAGGQIGPLVLRRDLLQVLIALLGCCQRVVAVAHREQQRCRVLQAVLFLHGLRRAHSRQGVRHGVHLGVRQLPALQVPAALLQVKVIQLLHLPAGGGQGLNNRAVRVVDQQHHVGQLNGGVLPYPYPGWDAGEHRPLRGPDQGAGAGGEVILVQIHHADEAVAHLAVGLRALNIEQGPRQGLKDALRQIAVHSAVDVRDMGVHIRVVQLGLRQDQPEGGRRVPHSLLHRLPILRLGGELVAGHHGPLGHVRILGQQDIRRVKAQLLEFLVHVASPFFPENSYSAALMAASRSSNSSKAGISGWSALICSVLLKRKPALLAWIIPKSLKLSPLAMVS